MRGKPADDTREKKWGHFSHKAAATRTPTLTFSESTVGQGVGGGDALKSGVMSNFLTV